MAGNDSSHGVSRVVRHKDFYLRGGDMTVLVENHLYRIHSYFFERESLFFRQKLSSLGSSSDAQLGLTDDNAYTLEDVKSEDFARFLWVFYNPKYSVYEAPLDTWLSILKLANRWTFDNVKELSIRELEKIDIEAVEKIAIYHDHSISRLYLVPSYVAICKRDKPLSFSEGTKLGMETVLRIAEARERLRLQASESGIRSPTFEDFEDNEVEVLIREIFSLGIRPTSPSSATSPASGVNSSVNGTNVKLGPAPPGNPSRANGNPGSRANGGLAADPRPSSVNALPSIASVMSRQESSTATQTPALAPAPAPAPVPPTPTTHTTVPKPTVEQEQRAPVPPAKTTQAASTPQPPPTMDKPKNNRGTGAQEAAQSPKSGGAGELSSSADSCQTGSNDVLISKTVVSPSEHSNDVTESNDGVNEGEKDELEKDNDNASVFSDEGSKAGKQGGRNKKTQKASRGRK